MAAFQITNLPAGETVVLLDTNRHSYVAEMPQYATVKDQVFFTESMGLQEDRISISGGNGYVDVTNLTDTDITDEIIIYYKNSASDILYGGITYRIRIEGGMKADEIKQITASHFDQAGSKIMFVTVG